MVAVEDRGGARRRGEKPDEIAGLVSQFLPRTLSGSVDVRQRVGRGSGLAAVRSDTDAATMTNSPGIR